MIVLPFPRAYIDWTVPCRPDGTAIVSTLNESDYGLYLNWLADYLYETEFAIPESQRGVQTTLFELSERLSIDWLYLDSLEMHIKEGGSFAAWHQREVEEFESLDKTEKQIWLESSESGSQEYLTEKDFNRIVREVADARRVPSGILHLDIPYRPVISQILKEIPEHVGRVAELDRFFSDISDNLSK